MELTSLQAISPIDGRYSKYTGELRNVFSEQGLIVNRVYVEMKWLRFLHKVLALDIPESTYTQLTQSVTNFASSTAERVKQIEEQTNHDAKAVELFVRGFVPDQFKEFVHFGATSEDINNIAYARSLENGLKILDGSLGKVIAELKVIANRYSDIPMLARTHGQPASPTTVGKEINVFYTRLRSRGESIWSIPIHAKFNGATGTYAALYAAYPDKEWNLLAIEFINALGYVYTTPTTQIEPQDYMVTIFDTLAHINNIMIDLCRDMWGYIALDYFKQRVAPGEVGSSTMPHKVNPIDFENAEANLNVANALFKLLSDKLPKSRWQRDLTNSSLLRNIGVAFAHSLVAYKAVERGLKKLEINKDKLENDLDQNWAVLTEAVQTVMRKHGIPDAYTQVKEFSRGKQITKDMLHGFIAWLNIPAEDKERLLKLTPATYVGYLVDYSNIRVSQ